MISLNEHSVLIDAQNTRASSRSDFVLPCGANMITLQAKFEFDTYIIEENIHACKK